MKMYSCNDCQSWWAVPAGKEREFACFECASTNYLCIDAKEAPATPTRPDPWMPEMIIASLRAELDLVRKERDVTLIDKRALWHNLDAVSASHEHLRSRVAELEAPIEMIMSCPACHTRHVDVGEFATKPHRNHACQNPECGIVFRICDRNTVGVRFLPGYQDDINWLFKPDATLVAERPQETIDWRALEVWRDGLEDAQIKNVIATLMMEIRELEGEVEVQIKITETRERARRTGLDSALVMLPVFEAAREWRKGRDRDRVGTAPPGGERSESGRRLIDAVDGALARLDAYAFEGLSIGVVIQLLSKAITQAKLEERRVEGECS